MSATAEIVNVVTYTGEMDDALCISDALNTPYVMHHIPVETNVPAIFSVWLRSDTPTKVRIDAMGYQFGADVGTDWIRAVCKISVPEGNEIRIIPLSADPIYLYRAMVESNATLPSDWTAAPEDTDGMIRESYDTSRNVRSWFTFSEYGMEVRKTGSDWYTETTADGFYIKHTQVAGYVGAFHEDTFEPRSIRMGAMICKGNSNGGWTWSVVPH